MGQAVQTDPIRYIFPGQAAIQVFPFRTRLEIQVKHVVEEVAQLTHGEIQA